MPDLTRSSLILYVSPHRISCELTKGWLNPVTTPLLQKSLSKQTGDLPDFIELLREPLSHHLGTRTIKVILSDDYVRFFSVTPPENIQSIKDLKIAVASRFQSLYGERSTGWQLEAEWEIEKPFIACAIPAHLSQALKNLAKQFGLRIVHVTPQFVSDWNTYCHRFQTESWFASFYENRLTLALIDQNALCTIHSTRISEHAYRQKAWLSEYVSREAIKLNIPKPVTIQLCGANISKKWLRDNSQGIRYQLLTPVAPMSTEGKDDPLFVAKVAVRSKSIQSMRAMAIDFAPPSYFRSFYTKTYTSLTLSCIAIGVLFCISFTAFDLMRNFQETKVISDRVQISMTKKNSRSLLPSKKASVLSTVQAQAINQAVQQLNTPWHDMFNAVEKSTPNKIALMELEPDTQKGRLKGLAEAKYFEDMIDYIERLKKQTFFDHVILTKHEINEKDLNKPIRFQFEAYWLKEAE